MKSNLLDQYRGFQIRVDVIETSRIVMAGAERRFAVGWSVLRPRCNMGFSELIASLEEPVAFLSEDDAIRYGEGRAHTWVDCAFRRQKP
jgi:hypothetical protein